MQPVGSILDKSDAINKMSTWASYPLGIRII